MAVSYQLALGVARIAAQTYVARFIPDEFPYFSVIWEEITPRADVTIPKKSMRDLLAKRLKGIGFAEGQSLRLATPWVIATALTTANELRERLEMPDQDQVFKGIAACAESFGLSSGQAKQLAEFLAPRLRQQMGELQEEAKGSTEKHAPEERITVIVSADGTVNVVGRSSVRLSGQEMPLWSHFVRHTRVHWAEAFIIFENWTLGRPKDPVRQFEVAVSRLNRKLKETGCRIRVKAIKEKHSRRNTGDWRLDIPREVSLTGDLIKSRDEIEKTRRAVEEEAYGEAARMAVSALEKDPDSVEAPNLLTKAMTEGQGFEISNEALNEARKAVRRRMCHLRRAISDLSEVLEKRQQDPAYPDIQEVLQKAQNCQVEATTALEVLDNSLDNSALPPEDWKFETIRTRIKQFRDSKESAGSGPFKELGTTEEVKQIIQATFERSLKVLGPLIGNMSEEESQDVTRQIQKTILGWLKMVLKKPSTDPDRFMSLEQFLGSLKRQLMLGVIESVVSEHAGVSGEDQRKARNLHEEIKRRWPGEEKPEDEQQIWSSLEAKWSLDQFKAASEASTKMNACLSMNAYYSVFRSRHR